MDNTFIRFIRSLTAAGLIRILAAVVLSTLSVRLAFREAATLRLVIGCDLFVLAGALYLEYKSFRSRS